MHRERDADTLAEVVVRPHLQIFIGLEEAAMIQDVAEAVGTDKAFMFFGMQRPPA